jgi:hypothetical protein
MCNGLDLHWRNTVTNKPPAEIQTLIDAHINGITSEHLSYDTGFWNVEGSSAYAVISGTLTVTIKGQAVVRTGTLAYTFANRDGVWKIEAKAWGPHIVACFSCATDDLA